MKALSLLLLLLCFSNGCRSGSEKNQELRIGSKNFAEQLFLGEFLAQSIEKSGIPVDRKFGFGSTTLVHEALASGEIDLYIEYTGTATQVILKIAPDSPLEKIDEIYRSRFQSTWMPPLGFNNSYVLVTHSGGANTLSQLAAASSTIKAGLNAEFAGRADGYPALQKTYGLRFKEIALLDVGLIYDALLRRRVDVIGAFGTDGRLDQPGLQVIEDDQNCFPRYDACPVVRLKALESYPTLEPLLRSLKNRLSIEEMRRINRRIELEHESPRVIATEMIQNK